VIRKWKRREVVIEREETILLRSGTPMPEQQLCPICGPGSVLLTPETASRLHGHTVRTICRWAEGGEVHSLDAPDGRLLVCLSSLAQRAANLRGALQARSGKGRDS
jgi:hypothetical protein